MVAWGKGCKFVADFFSRASLCVRARMKSLSISIEIGRQQTIISMKKFCVLLLMLMCTLLTYAVPAGNVVITHTQKDGTVLTLRLVGDEHLHYYQDMATGQAMRQGADGDFVVITKSEMNVQAERAALRRADINKHRVARLPMMKQLQSRTNGPARAIGNFGTMTGTKKGLVILVNFTDVTFKVGATSTKQGNTTTWDYTGTKTAFNNQFNQQGYSQNGHIGSVKDYFSAQSYGNFTVDFDVVGPVTVSQNMAYYGAPSGNDNDSYPASMVIEACKLADAAGVDFSKYDWSGDGYVDQVFVIYAGYNEAQGGSKNTIWPHEWDLSSANYFGDGSGAFKLDGKWINTYACTSELAGYSGTTMDGIGTACHEFSHCLGYPDLYDTDYDDNGEGFGMSYYDLMASGSYNGPNGRGEVPCGYSAYERWMAGWITPTELNADAATITGMVTIDSQTEGGTVTSGNAALANSPSRAYIIKNGSDNNYYLLENRPNTGYFRYFNNSTSGSGLFITHVNYNATAWEENTVNAYGSNQRFIFIPADGSRSETSGFTTDFFPTSSVKSFREVSNKQVTNIAKTNGLISFDYNGGFQDDGTRYTITLDPCGGSVSPTSWTQNSYKQSWTLPEPTASVAGWEGAGWSLTQITSNILLDDVDLIDCGARHPYTPESDVTLYAVYINDDYICTSYPLPFGTYYSSKASSLDGKNGQALELALTGIIYPHTKRSYDNLWTDFKTTDVVPGTTDQIYDMYSSNVYHYSTASHSADFNREHVVPNSWWGGESGNSTAYTDLHHLVPSDQKANNLKSNYPLGCGHGLVNAQSSHSENSAALLWSFASTGADSYGGGAGHVWEPEDRYKGDFARMYLYVVCAYEGNITWQTNYMFTSDAQKHTTIKPWTKELLLKWHRQDPVSNKERARNNAVYGIQGNRNPFIDYPEFVEYIWGDKSSQKFSLSDAVSAYSAEYINAHPDLTGTANGTLCTNPDPEEPGVAALYFPHIAKVGQPFTAPAFNTNSDGAQSWTSSNETVATVDNEGHVTIKAKGTTIITVTQAETDTYKEGSASYMIKVVE